MAISDAAWSDLKRRGFDPGEWPRSRKLWLTAVYCASLTALGMVIGGIGPTIPGLGRRTDATLTEKKYFFPARALGYVVGSIMGPLYDKYPGSRILGLSAIAMGVFTFGASLMTSVWALCVVMACIGAAAGLLDTGTNTLLVWVWGSAVGPFMSTMHFFFGGGAFISPIVTSITLELAKGDVRPTLYVQAATCVPVALLFMLTGSPVAPERDGRLEGAERHELADDDSGGEGGASNGTNGWDLDTVDGAAAAAARKGAAASAAASAGAALSEPATPTAPKQSAADRRASSTQLAVAVFVSSFLCLAVGAEVGYGGWLATYTMDEHGAAESVAALATSTFWGSFTFGRLISIPLSMRLSPRTYLLADLAVGVLAAVLLMLASSMSMLWVGAALMGIAIASMFPSCVSLPPSLGLPVSGKLTSLFVVGSSVGEMVVPFVLGAAMDSFGPRALNTSMLITMLAMCALLGTLAIVFTRIKRRDPTRGGSGVGVGAFAAAAAAAAGNSKGATGEETTRLNAGETSLELVGVTDDIEDDTAAETRL